MRVDTSEIQGLVASGYPGLHAMCVWWFAIDDVPAMQAWLRSMSKRWAFIGDHTDLKLHLALTYAGVVELGGPRDGWEPAFVEGLCDPRRSRILGDVGDDAPSNWAWGGPEKPELHGAILFYARDDAALDELQQTVTLQGASVVHRLHSTALKHGREHFGFRDGLTNPSPAGLTSGRDPDVVPAGEFVLGMQDASGAQEPAPALARGSTMLTVRELEQDVAAFWGAMGDAPTELAAKIVGRTVDGQPLAPLVDEDFDYADDPLGRGCPLGAHIRRARPRSSFGRPEDQRHRLLRRGRAFGSPAPAEVFPAGVTVEAEQPTPQTAKRGLYFMCLSATFGRQFEFVQQTWLNNPKFMGVWDERDPLLFAGSFTVPQAPLRRRFQVPRFVKTVGGAYCVLPGRVLLTTLEGTDAT